MNALVWLFSILISSGSIASLSDTIFAWKGFVLDGIEFYRSIISPIKDIINYFYSTQISTIQTDVIVFYGLFHASYLRFTALKQLNRAKPEQLTKSLYVRAVIITAILWLVSVIFVSASILEKLSFIFDLIAGFLYIFPLIYPFYVLSLLNALNIQNESFLGQTLNAKNLKFYQENKIRLFIVYYGPVFIAIFVTLVLAAINSGLTRTE